MVKKVVAIYFTIILFIFVNACNKCKTYNQMEPLKYSRISIIKMYNVKSEPWDSTWLTLHAQAFGLHPEVLATPQIDIDSFGMKLTVSHETYATTQESFNPFIQNCFGKSIGGCPNDPGPGWAGVGDHPTKVTLYSNVAYDSLHPIGTSLNDLFMASFLVYQSSPNYPSNDGFYYKIISLTNVVEALECLDTECTFRLISMPTLNTTHTFSIVVNFESGRVLTASSATIQLTP